MKSQDLFGRLLKVVEELGRVQIKVAQFQDFTMWVRKDKLFFCGGRRQQLREERKPDSTTTTTLVDYRCLASLYHDCNYLNKCVGRVYAEEKNEDHH